MATTTIALFSHDSVGLGHARRNRALAHALAAGLPGPVRGLLVAGHPDAGRDRLPEGWDWLILPGLTTGPVGRVPRHLAMDPAALRDLRGAVVSAALDALRPDLFVVDRHPFGIDGELLPVLRDLRARGCATVLGLREVLDAPAVVAREWELAGGAEHIARHLDEVWIYGDAAVHDPRTTGELPAPLARLATVTGYLAHGRPPSRPPAGPEPAPPVVLTVLGGGSDGAAIAESAVRAVPPAGHHHLLVGGPQMPDADLARLRGLAGPTTTVVRSVPDAPERMAEAAAVVCMGGYNTLAELLVTDTPALVVPRSRRRQEQVRRARALAAAGAVDLPPAGPPTPQDITAWWAGAVGRRVDRSALDLDGLAVVPRLAARLLADVATPRTQEALRAG